MSFEILNYKLNELMSTGRIFIDVIISNVLNTVNIQDVVKYLSILNTVPGLCQTVICLFTIHLHDRSQLG